MKYDAKDAYKQARNQGKMRRFLDVIDGENMTDTYMDCRYKTADEINAEIQYERRRNFGEAIGCIVFLLLLTWVIFLLFCM